MTASRSRCRWASWCSSCCSRALPGWRQERGRRGGPRVVTCSNPSRPSSRRGAAVGSARMYETILFEVRDGVAHLTLNRPQVANGIDAVMARELLDALLRIEADDSARAVLLTGAGARF